MQLFLLRMQYIHIYISNIIIITHSYSYELSAALLDCADSSCLMQVKMRFIQPLDDQAHSSRAFLSLKTTPVSHRWSVMLSAIVLVPVDKREFLTDGFCKYFCLITGWHAASPSFCHLDISKFLTFLPSCFASFALLLASILPAVWTSQTWLTYWKQCKMFFGMIPQ